MASAEELMAHAIPQFVQLLQKRLGANVFTTEDSIRYTFFAALLRSGIEPEQVVLEARYTNIANAFLDMLLYNPSHEPLAAIEFKYDRAIPSGKNTPRPQKVGKVFSDLRRLLLWPGLVARYVVYVTDKEMYGYVTRSGNGLAPVFTLPSEQTLPIDVGFFTNLSATFRTNLGDWHGPATLRVVANAGLPQDHHLWIFAIQPDENN